GAGGTGVLSGATAVAAGGNFSAAIAGGNVYVWGDNSRGELGNNNALAPNSGAPVEVVTSLNGTFPALANIVQIAAGQTFMLALDSSGNVWAWGDNTADQLGTGVTNTDSFVAVKVLTGVGGGQLGGVTAIAAADYTAYALMSNGTVMAWGDGQFGEAGNGSTATPVQSPTTVLGPGGTGTLSGVASIAAGFGHALAVLSDGTVWSWGYN